MADTTKILPKLRFPEFANDGEWDVVKLGEVVTFCNSKCNRSELRIDTYISTENIRQDFLGIKRAVNLPQNGSFTKFRIGDILVSNIRPYLKKIWQANFDGAASNDVLVFRTKNQNYDEYVAHLIKSDAFVNYCMEGAKGVKMPRGDKSTMLEYSIPLPSLPEQQKIASLLTSLDEQISANTKKLEALKAHKKSLMQQLFPANCEKTPKLRFPEFKNAGEWEEDSMQNIFEIKNGYTPSKANDDYWTNGTIPWFRMEDIRNNGHILSDSIQHITPQAVKGGKLFPAFSIIVATTATIGEHALIIVDSLANQQFTFLTKCKSFDSKLDMLYFHYYMFIVDEWCKLNTNAGGLLSVNMSAFKQLQIPIPPLPEQQKIASFLSSIDDMIQAQDNKIQKLKTYKNGLMQQLFA